MVWSSLNEVLIKHDSRCPRSIISLCLCSATGYLCLVNSNICQSESSISAGSRRFYQSYTSVCVWCVCTGYFSTRLAYKVDRPVSGGQEGWLCSCYLKCVSALEDLSMPREYVSSRAVRDINLVSWQKGCVSVVRWCSPPLLRDCDLIAGGIMSALMYSSEQ